MTNTNDRKSRNGLKWIIGIFAVLLLAVCLEWFQVIDFVPPIVREGDNQSSSAQAVRQKTGVDISKDSLASLPGSDECIATYFELIPQERIFFLRSEPYEKVLIDQPEDMRGNIGLLFFDDNKLVGAAQLAFFDETETFKFKTVISNTCNTFLNYRFEGQRGISQGKVTSVPNRQTLEIYTKKGVYLLTMSYNVNNITSSFMKRGS